MNNEREPISYGGYEYRLATEEDVGKYVYYADNFLFHAAVSDEPRKLIEYRKNDLCPYKVENSMTLVDIGADPMSEGYAEYVEHALHWWQCAWVKENKDESKKT